VKRRIAIWTGAVLLLFVMLVALRLLQSAKIETRLEAIRKTGAPVTVEELNRYYPEPAKDENAAGIYENAFNRLNTTGDSKPLGPVTDQWYLISGPNAPWNKLSADDQKAVADYVAQNADALSMLRSASALSKSRYAVDFQSGIQAETPHLAKVRSSSRLLRLQVMLQLNDGHPDRAVESVVDSFRLANSLENEPLLISQLIRVACLHLSIDDIERILNRAPLRDPQLAALQKELEDSRDYAAFKKALVGERCLVVHTMLHRSPMELVGHDPADAPQRLIVSLARISGLVDLDIIQYLDLMDEAVKAMDTSRPADRLVLGRSLDGKVKRLPKYCILSRLLLPAYDGVFERSVRVLSLIDTAHTAVAIERYRLREGRLPDRLESLVPDYLPAVPEDPYDGNPLRFRRVENGFIVYSVGEDLTDDGGNFSHNDWTAPDITFRVGIEPEGLDPVPEPTRQREHRPRRVRRTQAVEPEKSPSESVKPDRSENSWFRISHRWARLVPWPDFGACFSGSC
jgi:hypothetical protein